MVARHHRLLSDERLAAMAGDGSDSAFAVLYGRYDAVLHSYCRSITRNADDARDALQNAMVKALLALRRRQLRGALRPWLFRIAHNEAIDVLQRRSPTEPLLDGHVGPLALSADEEAARRERIAEVVTDLHALPLSQRAALVMRELAGMPYDEIAEALATTQVNARQLVFSARAGLEDARDGRSLPCESVRGVVLTADGRELRRRPLRAHLRACSACRDFAADARRARRPRRRIAAIFAPLPALPQSLVSALANGGAAVAESGSGVVAPLLAKGAAVVALIAGAGVGTAEIAQRDAAQPPERAAAAPAPEKRKAAPRERDAPASNPAPAPLRAVPAVARAEPVLKTRAVADEPARRSEPQRAAEPEPERRTQVEREPDAPQRAPEPEPEPEPEPQPVRSEPPPPARAEPIHNSRSAAPRDCPPGGDGESDGGGRRGGGR